MDLNARVDVNFAKVDVILLNLFFYFDTDQPQGPTYIPYKISAKYT